MTHKDGDEAPGEEDREEGEVLEGAGREARLEVQHDVVDHGCKLLARHHTARKPPVQDNTRDRIDSRRGRSRSRPTRRAM